MAEPREMPVLGPPDVVRALADESVDFHWLADSAPNPRFRQPSLHRHQRDSHGSDGLCEARGAQFIQSAMPPRSG